MTKMQLNKAPFKVSELIKDLEEIKKDMGDLEVWMLSRQDASIGKKIELESVATVSGFMAQNSNIKGIMLISGKDYLTIN